MSQSAGAALQHDQEQHDMMARHAAQCAQLESAAGVILLDDMTNIRLSQDDESSASPREMLEVSTSDRVYFLGAFADDDCTGVLQTWLEEIRAAIAVRRHVSDNERYVDDLVHAH